jgi:hypothetical protein
MTKKDLAYNRFLFPLPGYGDNTTSWTKNPAGSDHSLKLKYSINRDAVYIDTVQFLSVSRKWNAFFGAGAGVPNVVNFSVLEMKQLYKL